MIYLICSNKHRESEKKMETKYPPSKKTSQTLVKDINEMEMNNLPDKELKVIVIEMLTKLWRILDEHSENFNKEVENIRTFSFPAFRYLKIRWKKRLEFM